MDIKRNGRFTSSEIYKLMANGKAKDTIGTPFYSYCEEVYFEIRLGRRLDNETSAKPTSWGNLVERQAFDCLGYEYELVSKDTIIYNSPEFSEWWAGTPDLKKNEDTICDVKCPMTLKSFCTFYECDNIDDVRIKHKDGEKYYWQLVSNSILTGCKNAELIIYAPYKNEIADIKELASNYDGDQNKVAWINWSNDDDLPYLENGGYYKNIKTITFDVPEYDKIALENRVRLAIKEVQNKLK